MAAFTLGRRAKTYWNTGTFGSPVWSTILRMRDETDDSSTETVDVSTRDTDYTLTAPVSKDNTITFQIVRDTSQASYLALELAYDNLAAIEILALDGPVTTVGSRGVRGTYSVTKFTENKAYKDIQVVDVELKPTLSDNGAPTRFVA